MGFYLAWPYFIGSSLAILLASTPILQVADPPSNASPSRVQSIDGLRGFLALSVFFHHGAIYHQYLLTGNWALPPTRFYADIGQVGVVIFFMITGYLFWTQMLKARGRQAFLKLYIGRVFRIVPLYLALVLFLFLSVGMLSEWRQEEPAAVVAKEIAKWLSGGVFMGGNINAVPFTPITAGVTWSLHFEWRFYASLLVIGQFARHRMLGISLPIVALIVAASLLVMNPTNIPLACTLMFSIGMSVASARYAFANELALPQWMLSSAGIICLGVVLISFDLIYSLVPILLIGAAFGLIVFGATAYGLLLKRSARRLGDISYGIYLLQGPVLFLAFGPSFVRSAVTASAWCHWSVLILAGGALVMLAALCHWLIERPGVKAGQRFYAMLLSFRAGTPRAASPSVPARQGGL